MIVGCYAKAVRDRHGEPMRDDTFLLLCNAHHEPVKFVLPGEEDVRWNLCMNSALESGFPEKAESIASGTALELIERSLVLLQLTAGEQAHARLAAFKRKPNPQKSVRRRRKNAKAQDEEK